MKEVIHYGRDRYIVSTSLAMLKSRKQNEEEEGEEEEQAEDTKERLRSAVWGETKSRGKLARYQNDRSERQTAKREKRS